MIHSSRFTAVLDTNILYPIVIRDVLLWFAHYDLYTPKWSNKIFDELRTVMERKGIPQSIIDHRIKMIHENFEDAMVINYEPLIDQVSLPDENDRHVLAAAIKTNANVIVTNNLKDFPSDYLSSLGLSAKNADDFIADIIDLNPNTAVKAFKELVLYRKNPKMDEYEVLDSLRRNGLKDSANYLHSLI